MKYLLRFLLLAALAVGLALAARNNDGYVLVVLPPWRLSLSLNLLVLLWVLGFAVMYLLVRGLVGLWQLPASVQAFRARQRAARAESGLRDAMRHLFEGRYSHALRRAAQSWEEGHAPGLAALLAARAAHLMRDEPRRAQWLARAEAHDAEIRQARLMVAAGAALDDRDFAAARQTLELLAREAGRHIAAQRLALRALQGQGKWQAVLRVLRVLEKHKALAPEHVAVLRRRAHRENLKTLSGELDPLQRYIAAIEPEDLREPGLLTTAVRALRALGNAYDANRLIENALADQWDADLVELYGEGEGRDALGRIAHGEIWLQDHPRDPRLLLTLGRLCLQQSLWGKARSYLEASLSLEERFTTHVALARLHERLGTRDLANHHFRCAINISLVRDS